MHPLSEERDNMYTTSYALKFNSSIDRVTVPHSDHFDFKSKITIEVWVYLERVSTGYFIAKKQTFALAIKKQHIIIALNNDEPGWVWKNTKYELPLKVWTHVAMTYCEESGEAIVYANGKEVKVFSDMEGNLHCTKNELYFGLHLAQQYICGMISDVRLWSRVLSVQEILQEISGVRDPQSVVNKDNLVAWWPLDSGYGINVKDISNNKLNGTLTGTMWVRSGRCTVNQRSSRIELDLKSMINSPIGSDVKLRASDSGLDNFIYCHKIILCQRSDVFKAMLLGSHKEGSLPIVTLNDISSDVLNQVIEYIYTDKVEIKGDTVLELYSAADAYRLDFLKCKCEEFMQENINLENVCVILEAADQHQARLLCAECIRWILKNFWLVLSSEYYLDLPRKLMGEINNAAAQEFNQNAKRRKIQEHFGDIFLEPIPDYYDPTT